MNFDFDFKIQNQKSCNLKITIKKQNRKTLLGLPIEIQYSIFRLELLLILSKH